MAHKGKSGAPLDLVLLDDISEDSIVRTLQSHFGTNEIYTYIGPTLISVNPYKLINGMYGPSVIKKFVGKKPYENIPHVYAVAEAAYRNMTISLTNECVVITGESGSGKTEASKRVMEYVAAMSSKSKDVLRVKEQLLESNPLLESFGNAKTLRNDNSSRFGKYMEILFKYGDPSGGRITVYLLEKSRVVQTQEGERNYHIFYQILKGADSALKEQLQLTSADDFRYTAQSGCTTVDNMDDGKEFADTRKAMEKIGISGEEQEEVFRLVAAILHLGNVEFAEGEDHAKVEGTWFEAAAYQLFVPSERLEKALTERTIKTGGELITSPLSAEQAASARDALAKTLYGKLFDWIVRRANETIHAEKHSSSIGVLDIFGFEILGVNQFEQLCINFTNEKLHQLFIELTLKAEQNEYASEGVKWEQISYYDNKPVCDLIEAKHKFFDLLNEESIFPNGTDKSLFQKLTSNLGREKEFQVAARSEEGEFQIQHYAGVVRYTTVGMLEKNKDTVYQDMVDMMKASDNSVGAHLFDDAPAAKAPAKKKPGRGGNQRPETTCVQYKKSMNQLMTALKSADQHYIRCIKPNEVKQAGVFQDELVQTQVQYLGLLENLKVRRAGFAFRLDYGRFLAKYKAVSKSFEWEPDARAGTEAILKTAKITDYEMGKTKVFIRNPQSIFAVEDKRREFLEEAASYLPPTDGLLFADKVMGMNANFERSPLLFVVGSEGFYFFNLRKDGEPDSGQATQFFPMEKIEALSYNSDNGWTTLHTTPYSGKFEDDPPVTLTYLIENLFGHEVENFVEVLGQMDVDIALTKQSGDPPLDSKDPESFKQTFESIGTGEMRPPERGEGNKGGGGGDGGCCVVL